MQTDTMGNEKPLMVGNSPEPWNVLDSEQGLTFLQCLSSWLIYQIPSECLFYARYCGPGLWHIQVTSLPLRGQGMWRPFPPKVRQVEVPQYNSKMNSDLFQLFSSLKTKPAHSFKYPVIVLSRLLRKEKAGYWKYCEPR